MSFFFFTSYTIYSHILILTYSYTHILIYSYTHIYLYSLYILIITYYHYIYATVWEQNGQKYS